MLSIGSISATEILNTISLSRDEGSSGICAGLGWAPRRLLPKAEVMGLDDGG